jgi:hypothetical protein
MSAKVLTEFNEVKAIKRVLRRAGSREYFRQGAWTPDPDEADNFSDAVEVAETCAEYGLTNVELALRFGTGAGDFFCTTIR